MIIEDPEEAKYRRIHFLTNKNSFFDDSFGDKRERQLIIED